MKTMYYKQLCILQKQYDIIVTVKATMIHFKSVCCSLTDIAFYYQWGSYKNTDGRTDCWVFLRVYDIIADNIGLPRVLIFMSLSNKAACL